MSGMMASRDSWFSDKENALFNELLDRGNCLWKLMTDSAMELEYGR